VAAAATTISGIFFCGSSKRTKELTAALVLEHPSIQGLHSLMTAIPVAATAPASPFARPLPRRVPAAPSTRRKHEKEKTECSTRFPNGRLPKVETTCSSSTRYAHVRLARTRKSLRLSSVDTARAEERRGRARAWQTSLSVDSETLNSAVRAASSFPCSRPPFVVVRSG
jgi:hypothetical protein